MSWSGHKECVFNAFKYSLGMGEIKGSNYKNLKVYESFFQILGVSHSPVVSFLTNRTRLIASLRTDTIDSSCCIGISVTLKNTLKIFHL